MVYNWWIYAIFVALFALYKYFARYLTYWKDRGVDGPKPVLVLGNLLDNFKTPITKLELERHKTYGKVYGFLRLTQPVISVTDIELIKLITMKDFKYFPNHMSIAPGDPFLSKVLICMQDDEWKRMRNIWVSAFTANKIRQMFPLVSECVDNAMEYFDEMATQQKPIELKKAFSSFAMDTIANTVFGVKVNSFKDPDGDYARFATDIFPIASPKVLIGFMLPVAVRNFLGFSFVSAEGSNYFKKLLRHIIKEKQSKNTKNNDLLEMLLTVEISDGKNDDKMRKLDDSEILGQCLQMVVAGTDTTSIILLYFTFILATRTEIQEKLYAEIKKYFENEKYENDTLIALPYLDAVLNETMRHYTPVVHFDRVANADYKLGETGITIPKGTVVNIPFHAIHHDPDYWPDPHEFKPERFFPENKDEIVPFTFAPFGFGPRICLGLKLGYSMMKAILANMIYRFEVVKMDDTPKEPIYNGKTMTNSCEPIYIILKKRQV